MSRWQSRTSTFLLTLAFCAVTSSVHAQSAGAAGEGIDLDINPNLVSPPTPSPAKPEHPVTPRTPPVASAPQSAPATTPPPVAPPKMTQTRAPLMNTPPSKPISATVPLAPQPPSANHDPEPLVSPHDAPTGPQTPSLRIEKIGPATLGVGKQLTYEIVVRNPSSVSVFNVRIEEELPAGTQLLSASPSPEGPGKVLVWNVAAIDPGAEKRFRIDVQPAGEGQITSLTRATFSVAASLHTQITQPRLAVSLSAPAQAAVGDSVVFHIHVTNTGTGSATGVVVRDRLPTGLKHPQGTDIEADLGTIDAGQSKDLALTCTANKGGRVANEVVATADGGLMARAQSLIVILEPELSLRKTGPMRRYLNREAEFDLEVSNPGTGPARDVRVVDVLPPGLEFVAASDNGAYEENTRTTTWTLGVLQPAEHRHVKVRAAARGVGDLVNRATATADGQLLARAETMVHVEGIPAIMLEVVDLDDPVEIGAETSYEIRVRNQGTAPSTHLQILCTAPAGMSIRGAEGPTRYRVQGQQIVFEPIGRLAPRADARFRVRVVGMKAGDMRFKVQMNEDHLKQPVYEEESTQVYDDAK